MSALVLGEFAGPGPLLAAARALREAGRAGLDTHTPYPVEGLSEALGLGRSRVPLLVLLGALLGAALGYLLQVYCNAVDWPINVGGRPPHAAPAFVPITFETAVLLGAFAAFFGLLALLGLPRHHHPAFDSEAFRSASVDGFWLSVEVAAPGDAGPVEDELRRLGATTVTVVGVGQP